MTVSLVPPRFAAEVGGYDAEAGVTGADWLRSLPRLVDECLERWELVRDGTAMHGYAALVLPVRRGAEPAVLKLTWPHPEAAYEHLALRAWDGHGAVRLLAADPARWAMLLERLDAERSLYDEPIEDACTAIGGLVRALDVPALPRLDTLSGYAAELDESLREGVPRLPRRFAEQARSLLRDLTADPGVDGRLVHTDLHYGNVLHGRDGQWLAIDPKPLAAEPAYAVAPNLWNRWADVLDGNIRWNLRHRLELICDAAGIDTDRARAWTIVREADNAQDGGTGPDGYDRATMAVAIIKAMQD